MTPLVLLLAAAQAGLLLWGAIHLSNATLWPKARGPLFWALVTLALPLGIARSGADQDRQRALCGAGDCLILALSVAGVRVWAVKREDGLLSLEHEENLRRAAAAAEAAAQAQQAAQLQAAAAALEARATAEGKLKPADPHRPARHLTPSLLRGGAPSPRLPPALRT
jgi:hypothetical protein